MKTALITAIGSFSADIAIKNLKKLKFRVVGCDIYPKEWVANALDVDFFAQAPLAKDKTEYIEFIQNLCLREQIEYILPSTDIEVDVLNLYRDWFEEHRICLCLSSEKTISLCRNKAKMAEFTVCLQNIKTIPTYSLKGFSNNSECPVEKFPVICKPIDGRSSQGIQRIFSKQEWYNFCSIQNLNNYILQPCIAGGVVTVDIVRQLDGQKTIAVPRQEKLRTLNGAGTSVYVYSDEKLQNVCRELADALDIIGCVNFEFIKTEDNDYYFIECNPRLSGGVAFTCLAGYDCIKNHIAAFDGEDIEELPNIPNQYIVKKYVEYVTCIE